MAKKSIASRRDYGLDSIDEVDVALQRDYLAALYQVAGMGGVDKEEANTIDALADMLGVSEGTLDEARKAARDPGLLASLRGRIEGAWVIRDALRVAIADGSVDEDEHSFVARIAVELGVPPAKAAWILSWVRREQDLRVEWFTIVEAGG